MADLSLYAYQEEVVERALRGENIIIWLPTGSGKTRAAVYVAKRHLESTPEARVVVLVNRTHLVDQHYKNEFKPHLSPDFSIFPVSGKSEQRDFFGNVLQDSNVVICTAQILYNALTNMEEAKQVELSDITLLIIDECHNTNKEGVYNKIMRRYVEKKLKGDEKLPQILGLTASPGSAGAKMLDKAVGHVLQICANLDSAIVSPKEHVRELNKNVPRPVKTFDVVEKRKQDPFGDHVRGMMLQIHEYMDLPAYITLGQCGTQEYEAGVVELEKFGVKTYNRVTQQCALHLRQYNDALLINDTLLMMDAYQSLKEFYDAKLTTAIDETDHLLLGLFQENQEELRRLASDPRYENPKMAKLEVTLLQEFGHGVESKGIIFSKTRKSTRCLNDWILSNAALQAAGVRADAIIGAGGGLGSMSQNEQAETIRKFREGTLNLLVSTSVAEEGLDIPECNLVVRYGLLTNEIAQLQASGRARAKNSRYSLVAQEGGREECREHTNEYLERLTEQAIAKVQQMSSRDFRSKIAHLQRKGMETWRAAESLRNEKNSRCAASSVGLLCRNCLTLVACGSDIKRLEDSHYVNINPDFKKHYRVGEQISLERDFEDWEPGCEIICNNGNCSQKWGYEMKYKEVALLPNIAVKQFVLETPERLLVKKWKNVPFTVDGFSFEEYCQNNVPDLLD